jgi:hypothetical protein
MMLGREKTRWWLGFIPVRDDAAAEKDCRARLATLGVALTDYGLLVRSLSGGQRQSVAIARSLAEHVKLICLDEPTASLGVKQTAQVARLIRSIAARGTGVVLISRSCHGPSARQSNRCSQPWPRRLRRFGRAPSCRSTVGTDGERDRDHRLTRALNRWGQRSSAEGIRDSGDRH